MKLFNIFMILLVVTMCCTDICTGVLLPLLKGLKKKLIYGSYAPTYGFRGSYNGYGYGYSGGVYANAGYGARPHRYRGSSRRTGRTYSDIARVINPNPYAFVGKRPYPGQPFYPQG